MRLRQCRDDVLGDPVGEEFLFRVAAHVLESEHRDRRLVWQREAARRRFADGSRRVGTELIDSHRARDILKLLLAGILKVPVDLAAHLAVSIVGNADATRLGNAFQSRGNVNAFAEDIVVFDHDIADVNANSQFDPRFGRHPRVALSHATLDFDGAAGSVDRTDKFDQHAIACAFYDPAAILGNCRLKELAPVFVQPRQRAFLVGFH